MQHGAASQTRRQPPSMALATGYEKLTQCQKSAGVGVGVGVGARTDDISKLFFGYTERSLSSTILHRVKVGWVSYLGLLSPGATPLPPSEQPSEWGGQGLALQ